MLILRIWSNILWCSYAHAYVLQTRCMLHSYFLNICYKLHFNGHVDLICTEVWRGMARRVLFTAELKTRVYETHAYHTPTILIVELRSSRGTAVFYERSRVNTLHDAHSKTARALRISSFAYAVAPRERQWSDENNGANEALTARYVKPTVNFAIGITYVRTYVRTERFVGGAVAREMRCVCLMRKWQIRIAAEQPHRAGGVLSLSLRSLLTRLRLVLPFSWNFTTRSALCGITLPIPSPTRSTRFSVLAAIRSPTNLARSTN